MPKQHASPKAVLSLFAIGFCVVIIGIVVITSRWDKPASAASSNQDYYGMGSIISKHPSVVEPYEYGYVTEFQDAPYLYIEFGRGGSPDSDRERSAQLTSMLLDWQKVNRDKQVISTSFTVGSAPLTRRAWTTGLLVTYQVR